MIDELMAVLRAGPTGKVGAWLLVLVTLVTWWRYLPAVLDARANSVALERQTRMQQVEQERADRMREVERLEGQIKASDERHAECMEGQRKLRDEIDRLQQIISRMLLQMPQLLAIDRTEESKRGEK